MSAWRGPGGGGDRSRLLNGGRGRGFTIHLPPRLNGRPHSASLLAPRAPPPALKAPTRLLPRDTFPNSPSQSSRRHSVGCFEGNQIRRAPVKLHGMMNPRPRAPNSDTSVTPENTTRLVDSSWFSSALKPYFTICFL